MKGILASRCFLFDLDGTIYLGDRLLPGARDLLTFLDEISRPYYFLTNNSSRSRSDYALKLAGLGLAVSAEQVYSSGLATALTLLKIKPGARVYLVGTPSLEGEFRSFGFQLVDQDPDYLVLGFDTTLTYDKARKLTEFILEGVPYLATHPDINCPTPEGFIPDIGSIMAMIEATTGRQPDLLIGKPHSPMIDGILALTGLQPRELTMVGDRLYTDIALGKEGIHTVLLLSGETRLEDLPSAPHQPDLVCQDLRELLDYLQGGYQD